MRLTIKIGTAIEAVKKNQKDHIAELQEASTNWVTLMKAALDRFRETVDRKGLQASHGEIQTLMLSRPRDNRSDYSKFLSALERTQADGQEYVEVSENDYDRIFNDNWDWRIQSKVSNAAYTAKKD